MSCRSIDHLRSFDKMAQFSSTNLRNFGRCFCIITGASKGFGRAVAHGVSHLMEPGSVLVLAARSGPLLHQLKEELQSSREKETLTVHCVAVDLATKEGVDEVVKVARQGADGDFDHVLLVNNAASLGEISKFSSFTSLEKLNAYLSLNVSSAMALTAGMLQAFPCRPGLRWIVVNVSSTFALNPMQKWSLYCTAKIARKTMFSILAEEEPSVKVLNYSPGPMDTDMQKDIRRQTGISYQLLQCQEPAAKLLNLLLDGDFPSGTHRDFFEE